MYLFCLQVFKVFFLNSPFAHPEIERIFKDFSKTTDELIEFKGKQE